MGVQGLWKLLAPCGRRISVETLEHTTLAIDVSIWLTQFVKAMRDDEGRPIRNAHLIGTLRRVAKLLYHGVRPVFVFDGGVPVVKARLIRQRQMRREKNRDDLPGQSIDEALEEAELRYIEDHPEEFQDDAREEPAAPAVVDLSRDDDGDFAEGGGGGFVGDDDGGFADGDGGGGFAEEDGGFMKDDESGGGFMKDDESGGFVKDDESGGFVKDGGGFVKDDDDDCATRWSARRTGTSRPWPRRRRVRRPARRARLRRRGRARGSPPPAAAAAGWVDGDDDVALAAAEREAASLRREMSRSSRDADSVTEDMREDTMHLLRLLGVPYVVAPMEAEAQCAALEAAGLCEGVVTDDSDAFCFGARRVYKNIFDDRKYVEAYYASDCARDLRLGRDEFCALALLLGGDYDNGVAGVGVVNAMEVLQAFHFVEDGEPRDVAASLKRFKAWLDGGDGWADDGAVRASRRSTERARWETPPAFPSANALRAYLRPQPGSSARRAAPPAGRRRRDEAAAQGPGAPKGRRSAYIFFGNAKRAEVKELHPDFSLGDVGRELGARWKALSDDDKKPYAALATADAERYDREMAAYKATRPAAGAADEEEEEEAEAWRRRGAPRPREPLLAEEPGGGRLGVGGFG
ncbi:hypothetical protein JL721_4394 [Aureococcus anophagefferens]|nr:hypothetical protein JL721_4394 [Aureococcus anophagefferens]